MLLLIRVERAKEIARGTNKQTMLTLVRVEGASVITRDKQTNKQTMSILINHYSSVGLEE